MSALWLKHHTDALLRGVSVLCALPGVYLAVAYYGDALGPTPLGTLLQVTGRSALVILIASLLVTPLRKTMASIATAARWRWGKRVADWNWMVRLRRPLGLWCFGFASVHLGLYVALDLGYDWDALLDEMRNKPYLLLGTLTWCLLAPLAATSSKSMMKRLGRHWVTLHSTVYLTVVLALMHFWLLTKHGVYAPWPDTLAICLLLLYRVVIKLGLLTRWDGADGTESPDRASDCLNIHRASQ